MSDWKGQGTEAEMWTSETAGSGASVLGHTYEWQDSPFKNVTVDFLLRGGTRVFYELGSGFNEGTPWIFSLQWGRAGTDSWTDVTSDTDVFFLTDPSQREYGQVLRGFYRIKLVTSDDNTYYSKPSNIPNEFTTRDLRILEEIRRREILVNSPGQQGVRFWILYRKHWGTECTACVDNVTKEIKNKKCTTCYGTGFVGGYWPPYPAVGKILQSADAVAQTPVGTRDPSQCSLRFCPMYPPSAYDVVMLKSSDERYIIEKADTVAQIKGKPVIQQLTMTRVSPSDIIYDMKSSWGGIGPTGGSDSDF